MKCGKPNAESEPNFESASYAASLSAIYQGARGVRYRLRTTTNVDILQVSKRTKVRQSSSAKTAMHQNQFTA